METARVDSVLIEQLEDFEKLRDVADGISAPKGSIVFVAMSGDSIVGRLMLLRPVHVEGAWIEERYRGGMILKRLFSVIEGLAKNNGLSKLFAYASDSQNADYLVRLGYEKTDLQVFVKCL